VVGTPPRWAATAIPAERKNPPAALAGKVFPCRLARWMLRAFEPRNVPTATASGPTVERFGKATAGERDEPARDRLASVHERSRGDSLERGRAGARATDQDGPALARGEGSVAVACGHRMMPFAGTHRAGGRVGRFRAPHSISSGSGSGSDRRYQANRATISAAA